jgi:hypothetical protein
MEFAQALRLLPGAYAAAIVLAREGLDHARIGEQLAMDEEAVGMLLDIGWAKLAALETNGADGSDEIK